MAFQRAECHLSASEMPHFSASEAMFQIVNWGFGVLENSESSGSPKFSGPIFPCQKLQCAGCITLQQAVYYKNRYNGYGDR